MIKITDNRDESEVIPNCDIVHIYHSEIMNVVGPNKPILNATLSTGYTISIGFDDIKELYNEID